LVDAEGVLRAIASYSKADVDVWVIILDVENTVHLVEDVADALGVGTA
jgi:hypothetical protein